MKRLVLLSILVCAGGCGTAVRSTGATDTPADPGEPLAASSLVGRWRVDLRPTPDAEPYHRTMVIDGVDKGVVSGSFYGAEMKRGRANDDWRDVGDVVFAFVTEDGSGPYHTSGILRDGSLVGVTHSLGRGFASRWTAERIEDPEGD